MGSRPQSAVGTMADPEFTNADTLITSKNGWKSFFHIEHPVIFTFFELYIHFYIEVVQIILF